MSVMLGLYNGIDAATLSGGSWESSLPLNNLKNRVLGKVARSTDDSNASTKFDINLGSAKNTRIISLVNHNCSVDATYRIRGASDAGFTTILYDTGVLPVWASVYQSTDLDWESDAFWSGTYSPEEIAGFTTNLVTILTQDSFAQYWRVEIFDTTNPDGYVQIGRVFIGRAWQPEHDMEVGANITWNTTTTSTTALSGARYFQRRTPYRVTNFTLNVMSVDESMANAFEIDRRSGLDAEIMYIFDSADTLHAIRRQYLGTIRELTPVEYPYANYTSKAYSIQELI